MMQRRYTSMESTPLTAENTPGITFGKEGIPDLSAVLTAFWENVIQKIPCTLVYRDDRVYLVSNNPKAKIGSAKIV